MAEQRETIKCSNCRRHVYVDGYKVNRLGRRLKTCLECNARGKRIRMRDACPHGRRKSRCKDCGGKDICHHGVVERACRACGGSDFCPHGRRKALCRDCGGSQVCPHGRQIQYCRECGGTAYCAHNRLKRNCFACSPVEALWRRAHARAWIEIQHVPTRDLLGCSKDEFYQHIEKQFALPENEGMCWERIDEIEIDHRTPINYENPTREDVIARLHYLNCSPMWRSDNRSKGSRYATSPLKAAQFTEAEMDAYVAELLAEM